MGSWVDGGVDAYMGGWVGGRMGSWVDGWVGGRGVDGWMNGYMGVDGWMEEWKHRLVDKQTG